jgi:hypothetical protein
MIREPLRPGDPVHIPAWGNNGPIAGTVLRDDGSTICVRWEDGTESLPDRYGPMKAGEPPAWEPPAAPDPPSVLWWVWNGDWHVTVSEAVADASRKKGLKVVPYRPER